MTERPAPPLSLPLPPLVAERLGALRERPIEATEKGFGSLRGRASAASLAAARPWLPQAGLSYPLLTVRESALANNLAVMAAYCAQAGVALAPHGKTAMSPELAARQLAHGAWGITVASIGQLQTYRAFGFPRLLLANELTDTAGIARLAALARPRSDPKPFSVGSMGRSRSPPSRSVTSGGSGTSGAGGSSVTSASYPRLWPRYSRTRPRRISRRVPVRAIPGDRFRTACCDLHRR